MNTPHNPVREESPASDNTGSRRIPVTPKIDPTAHPTRLQELMNIQSAWLARHNARMADGF